MGILQDLQKMNKLCTAANNRLNGMDNGVKPPAGPYEVELAGFELVSIKDMPCLKNVYSITTGKNDGDCVSTLNFLNSDWGIAFALNTLISLGVKNVRKRFKNNKMVEFQAFTNEVNKITNIFLIDLTYNDKDYMQIKVIRKIGEAKAEVVEPEPVEPEIVENIEVVEELPAETETVTEPEEEIVDDFAEELPETSMYDDADTSSLPECLKEEELEDDLEAEIPVIEELETEKKKDISKYTKKLQNFAYGHDLIADPKKLTAQEIVDQINVDADVDMNDLSKAEKTLLKNVGLIK